MTYRRRRTKIPLEKVISVGILLERRTRSGARISPITNSGIKVIIGASNNNGPVGFYYAFFVSLVIAESCTLLKTFHYSHY